MANPRPPLAGPETWDEAGARVSRIVATLPAVASEERRGSAAWSVGGKVFAWLRPFSKADIRRFGDDPVPPGPILAVRVADLADKEAVLEGGSDALFTIPHFAGYPAILIDLDRVAEAELRGALVDGWLACAPTALAREHAAGLTEG